MITLGGCGPLTSESPPSRNPSSDSLLLLLWLTQCTALCQETAAPSKVHFPDRSCPRPPQGWSRQFLCPPLVCLAPKFFSDGGGWPPNSHGKVGARGQLRAMAESSWEQQTDVHMVEQTQTDSRRCNDTAQEESSCRER
uniref:Uncharacterized protein n=1 Tax=Pipistrellus kuhlii TaxID=59472 RepID=A0A7J8B1U5_PIPKU|nr:hypothetical protein mPipKuh1_007671 [Pipistrellus kuhlii]